MYEDCYVTAVVKCAPPGDRPTPGELANCSAYLEDEIVFMKNLRAVLALGAFAFGAYLDHLKGRGVPVKGLLFRHGGRYAFEGSPTLYASFHPSPRNTNTGKLSHRMLVDVLKGISRDLARHG